VHESDFSDEFSLHQDVLAATHGCQNSIPYFTRVIIALIWRKKLVKQSHMDSGNKMNKGKSPGTGRVVDKLPITGSYFAIRRYCLNKGVKAFTYDEFEDRLPRPKKKTEPRGATIIIRKSSDLKKNPPEESHEKRNTSTQEDCSEVKALEKELIQLVRSLSFIGAEKSGKKKYQDLLAQIYYKVEELIKIDPAKAKSPLSDEMQETYTMLCAVA
jgi:hypothetical protein